MDLSSTNTISIDQIMQVPKSIPAYQRDFVWEQPLIQSYVENLYEAFESSESYFTGSMVFYKNRDTYEIVDGQQRITVLYCIIGEIIKYLGENDLSKDDAPTQKGKYIFNSNTSKLGDKKFLLTHRNKEIEICLQKIGLGEIVEQIDGETPSVLLKNLINCDNIINEFVREKLEKKGIEGLFKFFQYILQKVNIIHFLANDISDALLIYSRLNSGGKVLGHLEIIKGQLFSSIDQNESEKWDKLDSSWNDFWVKFKYPIKIGGMGQSKPLINETSFLTYLFFINYPDLVIKETNESVGFLSTQKISDFLLNQNVKKCLFSDPDNFISELDKFTYQVQKIREGVHDDEECQNLLTDIALLSQTQTQPLLFILRCQKDPVLFKMSLILTFRLVFIFTMSLTGSGTTSGEWRSLSNFVRKQMLQKNLKGIDLAEIVKEYVQGRIKFYWDNNFVPSIPLLKIDDDKRKVKQFLILAEMSIRNLSNINRKLYYNNFYFQKGYDVDHVEPKTSKLLENETLQNIGNACLLDMSDNRAAKNSPFSSSIKQNALKNSDNFITKSIVKNSDDQIGPSNKKAMDYLSVVEALNRDTILKREKEIINLIGKFFEI